MDLSKLPRMSNTPTPPPAADTVPQVPLAAGPAPVLAYTTPPPGAGAEAWISIVIGIILLFIQPFPKYVVSLITHHPFDTGLVDGTTQAPIAYRDLMEYWGDLSLTIFGLVLILDGVVIGINRRPTVVMAALSLTVIGTLANLAYVVMSYNTYGLALLSALAVAFGGYIAMSQWRLLMLVRGNEQRHLEPRI